MELLNIISRTFWDERFWLPTNYSWSQLEEYGKNHPYPNGYNILICFPIGGLLLVLRYFFEKYVYKPLGRHYGLKDKVTRRVSSNKILEKIYRKSKRPQMHQIKEAAELCSMSTRSVESWFRGRRNMDKYSLLKKFSESGWRFTFYLCAFTGGMWTLWSKPYLWETKYCWIGYPEQSLDSDIYWYYMIELGFYWSLLFSIFNDVKRKDFAEMVVHHVATISLMVFSWVLNFVRVGALVLAVHDAVDYWMEAAKMAKYIGKNNLCDGLFLIFTVIWFCTRMTFFPFRILRTTLFEGLYVSGAQPFPAYYLFNILLCLLQILNVIWGYLIVRMVYKVYRGQLAKDVRSDSEISDDEDENEVKTENGLKPHLNGFGSIENHEDTMQINRRSKN